jgi:hypothetical protein
MQPYAVALHQDTQHHQLQTDEKSMRHPVQKNLPQQEIQETSVSTGFQFN